MGRHVAPASLVSARQLGAYAPVQFSWNDTTMCFESVKSMATSCVKSGLTVFALVFYSMPTFLLGLLLLYYLYFQLTLAGFPIFPAGGYGQSCGTC